MRKNILVVVLVICSVNVQALSEKVMKELEVRDFETAREYLLEEYDANKPEDIYANAVTLQCSGRGDINEFMGLYEQSASLGYAKAQFRFARILFKLADLGVNKTANFANSKYWFDRASDQEYAPAFFELGDRYKNYFWGIKIKGSASIETYRKSYDLGYEPARFALASALYEYKDEFGFSDPTFKDRLMESIQLMELEAFRMNLDAWHILKGRYSLARRVGVVFKSDQISWEYTWYLLIQKHGKWRTNFDARNFQELSLLMTDKEKKKTEEFVAQVSSNLYKPARKDLAGWECSYYRYLSKNH